MIALLKHLGMFTAGSAVAALAAAALVLASSFALYAILVAASSQAVAATATAVIFALLTVAIGLLLPRILGARPQPVASRGAGLHPDHLQSAAEIGAATLGAATDMLLEHRRTRADRRRRARKR